MQALRPYGTVGIALMSASAIVLTPMAALEAPVASVRTAVELTADSASDFGDFFTEDENVLEYLSFAFTFLIDDHFDPESVAELQPTLDLLRFLTLGAAGAAPLFGAFLDPLAGLFGVTGLGDWLGGEAELAQVLFSRDFDPETWVGSFDAAALVSPIVHVPDWLLSTAVELASLVSGANFSVDDWLAAVGFNDMGQAGETFEAAMGLIAANINHDLIVAGLALGVVTQVINGDLSPIVADSDYFASLTNTASETIYNAWQALYGDLPVPVPDLG